MSKDPIYKMSPALNKKSATVPSRIYDAMIMGSGSRVGQSWSKHLVLEQAYERNAPYYSAVNIISQTVADMAIKVQVDVNGKKSFVSDHPILRLMERSCSRMELIERVAQYYTTLHDAYLNIVFGSNNKPLGLVVMPSQYVTPIQGDYKRPVLYYEYNEFKEKKLQPSEVIRIYKPSLRKYFESFSPAIPLQELISLNNAAITWNKNIAQAGGLPPIVVKAFGANEQQAQRIADNWQNQSGANKSHRIKVMSEELEFQKFSDNPHDAEWTNAVLMSMRMIFMTMGISSSLMNDAANKTYNNVHDARKALYTEACIPIAKRIYSAITRSLQQYYSDNPTIIIDTDRIEAVQEDRKIAVERLQRAVDTGILTANEARAELGYPPAKGATADLLQNARIINNIPKVDTQSNQEQQQPDEESIEGENTE